MNIGLDVHKRMCYYTMIDNNGKIFDAGKCRTTKICIEDFSKIMPPGSKVAVEASTSGLFVYEQLESHDVDVHLAHPAEVRPFAKKCAKTDDIDAEVLAELLYMDHLPEAHVPPSELCDVRVTVRHRGSLVKMQTQVKNRIHALLTQEGIQTPKVSDLFGKGGLEFLKGVDLRKPSKEALDNYLMVLELLARLIKMTSNGLMEKANDSEQAGWAMSVPGVGYYSALLILSEVGDVSRFSKPKSLTCYAGLVPRVSKSGDSEWYGHINRHSNGFLRWVLIQCTYRAVRSPNRFQKIYKNLKDKRGSKIAIVAAARHLLESIYWVLAKKECYKESGSNTAFRAS